MQKYMPKPHFFVFFSTGFANARQWLQILHPYRVLQLIHKNNSLRILSKSTLYFYHNFIFFLSSFTELFFIVFPLISPCFFKSFFDYMTYFKILFPSPVRRNQNISGRFACKPFYYNFRI